MRIDAFDLDTEFDGINEPSQRDPLDGHTTHAHVPRYR
jgi:hypothetical protein